MRKELGWPTLLSRRILRETLIIHRCLSRSTPNYLSSILKLTSSVHSHMSRSAATKGLQVSRVRTEFGRESFTFWGAHGWNSLPTNLRNKSHPTSFVSAAWAYTLSYKLLLLTLIPSRTSSCILSLYYSVLCMKLSRFCTGPFRSPFQLIFPAYFFLNTSPAILLK